MDQLRDLADPRLITGCIHCGASEETLDHVPSKVFLDEPFPENLPKLPSCWACNNGASLDEEYVACLIEATVAGSADPSEIRRPKIAAILQRSPGLKARLAAARTTDRQRALFTVEAQRVSNIVTKLARGHAAFELSRQLCTPPTVIAWQPINTIDRQQRERFDESPVADVISEIGSRSSQRLIVAQCSVTSVDGKSIHESAAINDWIEVQESRYRYLVVDDGDVPFAVETQRRLS